MADTHELIYTGGGEGENGNINPARAAAADFVERPAVACCFDCGCFISYFIRDDDSREFIYTSGDWDG